MLKTKRSSAEAPSPKFWRVTRPRVLMVDGQMLAFSDGDAIRRDIAQRLDPGALEGWAEPALGDPQPCPACGRLNFASDRICRPRMDARGHFVDRCRDDLREK